MAENADFSEICADCGLQFIGPPTEAIRKMGDKAVARHTMQEAGVPVVPGSEGALQSLDDARQWAEKIGFPLRLKASAGGGGRGMRVVRSMDELEEAWQMARREARTAFTSDDVYMERSIEEARHIEIQVLGDQHGHLVHLGERECSIQRRHQKLLEESPSPRRGCRLAPAARRVRPRRGRGRRLLQRGAPLSSSSIQTTTSTSWR